MARYYLDVRIKLAYMHLKRRIALYFTLWILALLAGVSLLVAGIFYQYSIVLKLWSTLLVVLLFIKLGYDAILNMRNQYTTFKQQSGVTDNALRKI